MCPELVYVEAHMFVYVVFVFLHGHSKMHSEAMVKLTIILIVAVVYINTIICLPPSLSQHWPPFSAHSGIGIMYIYVCIHLGD